MSIHFHPLTISDIRTETRDCVSIAFAVPEELKETYRFREGQTLTLRATVNGEEIRRSYSICSSPLENELRIAVKAVTDGKFSNYANSQLKKGDQIEVLPPTGKFYTKLDPDSNKEYVAFAAGSGITPIISIIKTILSKEPHSRFTLIYGNRNRSSIIFREQLEALKNLFMNRFRLIHILSREKTDAAIHYGRIDADKCSALGSTLLNFKGVDHYFLCGPGEMIFTVRDFLESVGVPSGAIHFELFTTPGQINNSGSETKSAPVEKGPVAMVTIKLDGRSIELPVPYQGMAILDAALQAGADLPYACKGGVCCTCRAKLVEGAVDMDTNYALEPEELRAGYILTCQSHPRSQRLLIDFDQK
ncbi:1,2-phenylacetyl-CoA epoxidase subunit PaaE [Flavihumibacter sp. UBA7668]|uniref:1,2-phenylacetyl-CoA epoxidase subunit PaaE n=1 Tax=Flavihumibacter sp. UBA7668 TaxID=1946542 RepID=UPI0025C03796|nr:1,2-phenylacetyl-CoA epoxidase subunit PaaE [Flavihumibacter sp. UBA7668]